MRSHPLDLQLTDPAWLHRCATLAAAGKRRAPDVAWALFRLESVVERLAAALADGAWQPQGYRVHLIRDPKPRAIAVAPFEDRIVHGALARLIEPLFLRSAVSGDLACRRGAGPSRAVLRLLSLQRRFRWALHLDLRAYFPSVDPDQAAALVAARAPAPRLQQALQAALAAGRGLIDRHGLRPALGLSADWPPAGVGLAIGSHTSQVIAAHVILHDLDHAVQRQLKVPGYVRYVDDLLLFHDSRPALREARAFIGAWLWRERRLRLKHPEARVQACSGTLIALGHALRREAAAPAPRSWRRLRRRLTEALHGDEEEAEITDSLGAMVRHLSRSP